jgi:hypothetical protein
MTPRSCGALHDVWRIVTSLRHIHTSSTQIHASLRRMHTSQMRTRTGYCNLLSLVRIFGCRIDAPAFESRKNLLVRVCCHRSAFRCWPVKPKSSLRGFSLGIRLHGNRYASSNRTNRVDGRKNDRQAQPWVLDVRAGRGGKPCSQE